MIAFGFNSFAEQRETNKQVARKSSYLRRSKSVVATLKIAGPIDLGLSVMWAAWDLDSDKPEKIGTEYAWGLTSPQFKWGKANYKYYDAKTDRYTKYYHYSTSDSIYSDIKEHTVRQGEATWTRKNNHESFGLLDVDEVTVVQLDCIDDVAQIKWGKGWRMPTCDELKELYSKCKWEWATLNGVEGYKVIGVNGNYIFLAGDKDGQGGYWSCERPISYEDDAYGLSFNRYNPIYEKYYRYATMSIRPVRDYAK